MADLAKRCENPTCPAASPLAGPPGRGPAVMCGVFLREMREGTIDLRDADQGVLLTLYNDPTTLHVYCCGEGVPGAKNSYLDCPVYEREIERRDAREKTLALDDPDEGMFAGAMDFDDGEWEMPESGYFVEHAA